MTIGNSIRKLKARQGESPNVADVTLTVMLDCDGPLGTEVVGVVGFDELPQAAAAPAMVSSRTRPNLRDM